MRDPMNAAELRRLAMECAARADHPECSTLERERLIKMREALLELACNADWLMGKSSPITMQTPTADFA